MIDNKIIPYAIWICKWEGLEPHALEIGGEPHIDGYKANGVPVHYIWREFIEAGKELLEISNNYINLGRFNRGKYIYEEFRKGAWQLSQKDFKDMRYYQINK